MTIEEQVRDLAAAIAAQAQAIADGTLTGPIPGACKRILDNAETLFAWAKQAALIPTHPNAWTDNHPDTCPTCRVCPICFVPRRPDQYTSSIGVENACDVCVEKGDAS